MCNNKYDTSDSFKNMSLRTGIKVLSIELTSGSATGLYGIINCNFRNDVVVNRTLDLLMKKYLKFCNQS